jgi:hypothetical protein
VVEVDKALFKLLRGVVVETSEQDGKDSWEILLDSRPEKY